MMRGVLVSAVSAMLLLAASSGATLANAAATGNTAASAPLAGNAINGARLYQSCTGCHSLVENDIGPKHRGVVGRRAGTVPGYSYSAALKASGIVWTPANLDRWLTKPPAMVPGTKMYFSVAKPQDRADIIAYLAKQK
jgi:cytochrome c